MLTKIAVLGVGRVGTAVARAALDAGLAVNVAASGAADDIALIAEIITPGATAHTAQDAVADADLVVAAVPLNKYRTLDPAMLEGKIVVDVMNHWAEVDGSLAEVSEDPRGTSEIVAAHLAGSRIVKTLNHIGYHEIEDDARRSSSDGRRALAIAGDDTEAVSAVTELIDRLGFEPVQAGPLTVGVAFEAGTPIFFGSFDADGMRVALADAGVTVAETAGIR